jgi:hypothetical protein
MTLPATAQAIYDLLLADPAIAAALGTYTLADGVTTRPAIAVLAANETLPPGTTAVGIEVTITEIPGYAPQVLLSEETLLNPTFRVHVMGWQSIAGLRAIAERVIALLPGATAASIEGDAPGDGIGVIDQVVVRWTNPVVFVTP